MVVCTLRMIEWLMTATLSCTFPPDSNFLGGEFLRLFTHSLKWLAFVAICLLGIWGHEYMHDSNFCLYLPPDSNPQRSLGVRIRRAGRHSKMSIIYANTYIK